MSSAFQDVRYACRVLRKNRLFTVASILTLALGIGANSAVFTLMDAALLRPLPFPQPERLVLVWEDTSMFGLKDSPVSIGNYVEWRARNRVFEQIGALEQTSSRLTGTSEPEQVQGSIVTASLFRTLGVRPALGRLFRDEEDTPGTARTVILSDGLWRRELGADPSIVGKTVHINEAPYEVVGVMPPGFRFPDARNELWRPVGVAYAATEFSNRGRHNAMVVGRLKPGVTLSQANADVGAIARRLQREYPDTNARVGAFVAPLRDHFVADVRALILVLAGAVAFLLLIACVNIANLLLSRVGDRRREVAIRTALGATRRHVARQLIVENLLLSGAGGLLGLAIALFGTTFLAKMLPPGISAMSAVTVDARVLVFTLAASVITCLGFGLLPVLQILRTDLHPALKQGGARQVAAGGMRGARGALVVSEVALTFVLLIFAALFIQSFARLRGMDPGFRTANVLTMKTPLSGRQYSDPERRARFYAEVLERVCSLPGVVSAGFSNGIPLIVKGNVNGFALEDRPKVAKDTFSNANYRVVTPDYLRTVGVRLREGRYLDRHDTSDGLPVVMINEAMKRKFWPGENALGKRLRFGDSLPWITIVGVVADMKQSGLERAPSPELYLPAAQVPTPLTGLAIQTKTDPTTIAAGARREIRAVDKDMPITDLMSMEQVLDRELLQRNVQKWLLSAFALVALLLASLGIYGVLAFLVSQRTREIGIRMALGADARHVLCAVAGRGIGLSAAGIAIGMASAAILGNAASKLLFGITPTDRTTFAAVTALLLVVASAASYLPARRAMNVDPILALRDE